MLQLNGPFPLRLSQNDLLDYFIRMIYYSILLESYRSSSVVLNQYRGSHRRCFMKKSVLRNFTKFTGKHLCQSLFFNKVADLRPATVFKKRLWHKCFPVNFVKFLRTPFLQNTSGRLLLSKVFSLLKKWIWILKATKVF